MGKIIAILLLVGVLLSYGGTGSPASAATGEKCVCKNDTNVMTQLHPALDPGSPYGFRSEASWDRQSACCQHGLKDQHVHFQEKGIGASIEDALHK